MLQLATDSSEFAVAQQAMTAVELSFDPAADRVTQGFDALNAENTTVLAELLVEQLATGDRATVTVWAVVVAGIGLLGLLGRWITTAVVRPVSAVRRSLRLLAEGDLTQDVDVAGSDEIDEMALALREAQNSLRTAMTSIGASSDALAGSARQPSNVSSDVSSNAERTSTESGRAAESADVVSRSVQSVASATEEMSASIAEPRDR